MENSGILSNILSPENRLFMRFCPIEIKILSGRIRPLKKIKQQKIAY